MVAMVVLINQSVVMHQTAQLNPPENWSHIHIMGFPLNAVQELHGFPGHMRHDAEHLAAAEDIVVHQQRWEDGSWP
jgi:hypothetical protein